MFQDDPKLSSSSDFKKFRTLVASLEQSSKKANEGDDDFAEAGEGPSFEEPKEALDEVEDDFEEAKDADFLDVDAAENSSEEPSYTTITFSRKKQKLVQTFVQAASKLDYQACLDCLHSYNRVDRLTNFLVSSMIPVL